MVKYRWFILVEVRLQTLTRIPIGAFTDITRAMCDLLIAYVIIVLDMSSSPRGALEEQDTEVVDVVGIILPFGKNAHTY